jgi:hypothetical protein
LDEWIKARDSPVLHTITERLETDTRVMRVVLDDLVLVEPPAVAVVETLREIPVVERLNFAD